MGATEARETYFPFSHCRLDAHIARFGECLGVGKDVVTVVTLLSDVAGEKTVVGRSNCGEMDHGRAPRDTLV